MSAPSSAPVKPSGIKPPTSRLVRPSVTSKPSSNGSSGENISRKSSEDLTKKKISDRNEGLDDGDQDRVSELPSLPGSRKTSEQMRKLSDGSGSALDAAYELARRLSEAGVRRMSDASIVLTTDTDSFIIGQRIYVNGVKPGVIQFIGETKFAPGEWAGIVLDDLSGKNDGSVGGVRYFQCQPKKGVFSRLTRLTRQPLDAVQLAALQTQQPQQSAANENGDDNSSTAGAVNTNGANSTMVTSPGAAPSPNSVVSVQSIGDLRLGDRVIVTSSQGSKAGILRYLGTAEFAAGQWAGVELDDPLGKNDGAVAGTRYFECQAQYGLFAPVHKVSRSPANQMRRTSTALNSSMTSSASQRQTGLMSRQSTRDSIGSDRASVTSAATSRASTAISRVRSTVNNPRLGVNSLTSPTHQSVRQKTSRPSVGGSAHSNLQDLLRERDQHIEQLMKEREMERSEVTRAAAQADEAEHQLAMLQRKFNEEKESFRTKMEELERLLLTAESIRATQTAQIDDLQFRLEEESILRSDLEAQQKGMDDKEKEWARQVEQLENEAQRCFEAEELAARYKDELDALANKGQHQESSALDSHQSNENERIRQLEAEAKTKEAEFLELKNVMQELSKSFQDEQLKCRNAEERIQVLETELQTTRKSLNETKDTGDAELDELKNKLELLESHKNDGEEQLFKLTEEKVKLETQLAEAQNLLEQTKKTGDVLEKESGEMKEQLEAMMRQNAESQDRMTKLNEEKSRLESQLTTSLASSDQTKLAGQVELNELKEKLDHLERHAAETEEQLFKLDEEKVRLELQLADSQESITKMEESAKAQAENTKQQLEELNNQIQVFQSQKTENEELLRKLEEDKVRLEAELQSAQSLLLESKEATQIQVDKKNDELKDLKGKLEVLERQEADIKIQLATLQDEKLKSESALQKQLAEEVERWTKKCQDLEKQKVASDQRLSQLDEEKSRLESELLRLSSSSSNVSQDLTRLHGELMAARQSLVESQLLVSQRDQEKTSLEQLNTNLRADLQSRDGRIDELSTTKVDLEHQIQEAKQALKDAQNKLETDKVDWERSNSQMNANLQSQEEKLVKLIQVEADLQGQLNTANQTLAEMRLESEKVKAELEESNKALGSELANKDKQINDLLSAEERYQNNLKEAKQECDQLKEQLNILQSLQQESVGGLSELQKTIAVLELEKSHLFADKNRLEETVVQLEKQLSALSVEKDESNRKIQERDSRLSQLTEEVTLLNEKFTAHVAELEQKLSENRKAEVTEQELQAALVEARSRANELQTALEVSQKKEQELEDIRGQLVSANKLHEEYIQQSQKDVMELKKQVDELSTVKDSMQERESKLQEELVMLKRQLDEQNSRLQSQLQETKKEAETVSQLLFDLEESQKRVKELQIAMDETDQRLAETQEVALRVKGLEEQLELKTVELKEEMDDRDKAEDRVLRMTENLACKEKELETMRQEIMELRKSTTDVSHLLTAFSTVDREKKQLESKVVELQVAAAAAFRGAGAEAAETDVRIKQLKEDYEMSQREISFLNSVIVDMQRKVDDLKLKLEVSQATILGQNILTPEKNRNGVKPTAVAPRLFCDICDLFDLHDTEDCPKQSSEDFDIPPVLLNHHSPVYTQHSHHGGSRGASRPYCDNCEVFGHTTSECQEEATF